MVRVCVIDDDEADRNKMVSILESTKPENVEYQKFLTEYRYDEYRALTDELAKISKSTSSHVAFSDSESGSIQEVKRYRREIALRGFEELCRYQPHIAIVDWSIYESTDMGETIASWLFSMGARVILVSQLFKKEHINAVAQGIGSKYDVVVNKFAAGFSEIVENLCPEIDAEVLVEYEQQDYFDYVAKHLGVVIPGTTVRVQPRGDDLKRALAEVYPLAFHRRKDDDPWVATRVDELGEEVVKRQDHAKQYRCHVLKGSRSEIEEYSARRYQFSGSRVRDPDQDRVHSVVIKVSGMGGEHAIVKFASRYQIIEEIARFRVFVNDNIAPRAGYIRSHFNFWGLGCIRYVNLGTSEHGKPGFERWKLRYLDPSIKTEEISAPISQFFKSTWWKPYANSQPFRDVDILDIYGKELLREDGIEGSREKFLQYITLGWPRKDEQGNSVVWNIRRDGTQNRPGCNVGLRTDFSKGFEVCNLPEIIGTSKFASIDWFFQTLTHGDLHSQNLLVAGTECWVIDFERSGFGPWLRDLAELEVDLLTALIHGDEPGPAEYCSFVEQLYFDVENSKWRDQITKGLPSIPNSFENEPQFQKAWAVISEIRKSIELPVFGNAVESLAIHVMLNAAFLAKRAYRYPEGARAIILASILCDNLAFDPYSK